MPLPTVPQGFGTVAVGRAPAPVDPGLAALQALADRLAGPVVSRRVPISLAAGATLYFPATQDIINTLTVTVLNGDLCIYAGNRTSGPSDYRVLPGNTRQYRLPPNVYDWTWQANGAQTDAVVTLGNL